MGHHVLESKGRCKLIRDTDLWLACHFLLAGARSLGLKKELSEILRWEWQGPGVWIRVDMDALGDADGLFDAAKREVAGFGGKISAAYLKGFVPRGWRLLDQSAEDVIGILNDIQNFTRGSA